jgi:Predicted nucleotide-binding protein containing TIR-like domain
MTKKSGAAVALAPERARTYISQADIPSLPLEKALKVAKAIGDNYGYKPSTPLQVAKALDVSPGSSGFKMLTGASIAYGITVGGYNAEAISITPLGLRIVRPTTEGDDLAAKREATLKPRVIREFLTKYDTAPVPKESIGQNVLLEMGVPQDRTAEVLKLILESAEAVGFLQTIKDRKYVELGNIGSADEVVDVEKGDQSPGELEPTRNPAPLATPIPISKPVATPAPSAILSDARARKVFITHGKNKALIEPIKKLLSFGELEAMVSVQTQTVSQSVPGKVMEEMRSCGAAIIHVEDERHLVDKEGNEHIVLNDNVLIEIGAAMALYGQRFILVVKEGVKLPSNLSGLLELRYKGDMLDMEETVKLLEAINDMKKRPLP